MNKYLSTENIQFIKSLFWIGAIVGGGVVFAGNLQWVSHEKFEIAMSEQSEALAYIEIRALRREISFLKTKVRENEATSSERIILPELERQLKDLEDTVD